MAIDVLAGKSDSVEGVQTFFGMKFYAPFISGKIWTGRTSVPAGRAG